MTLKAILSFGLQALLGFLLLPASLVLPFLVMQLPSVQNRNWAPLLAYAAGIAGVCALAAGVSIAFRRRWRGVVPGMVLSAVVIVSLIVMFFYELRV